VTTHWSLVLAAGQGPVRAGQEALADLARAYWPPLYAYARRLGHSPEDAQDLTQEFFARVIEKHYLTEADRAKGRFRTFLLVAFKRFLANEWDRARAAKRGGACATVPLEIESMEAECPQALADELTPDRLFDRQWARTLLARVLLRLQHDCEADGRAALFEGLRERLAGDPAGGSYAALGARLGLNEGAVKVAAHRLRRQYRDLLRQEIARTLSDPAQVEAELRDLFAAFGG
jgi:RNA polymerase sigma-70 factor (ECF subfamily)